MSPLQRLSFRSWFLLTGIISEPASSFAQGNFGGIPAIPGTIDSSPDKQGIRDVILRALAFVLDFLALSCVVIVIIAGVYLVFSQGGDEQKDKGKKAILYFILGLLVILFARVIVGFFTETIPNEI